MKKIAVIGAGTMGNGIAHTFAQNGFQVNLIDISEEALEKGIQTISANLDRMIAREKISEADKNETLSNITKFTNTEEGRSEEHTSELQSRGHLVCRLLHEKKNN